jgi:hypothetical protein
MRPSQFHALLFIFLTVTQASVIQVTQKPTVEEAQKEAEKRRLSLVAAGFGLAAFLTGYLVGRYLKDDPILWSNDEAWEQRFLQVAKTDNLAIEFLNLIVDNFAMDLTNACMRRYHAQYEQNLSEVDRRFGEKNESEEALQMKSDHYNARVKKMRLCSDFFMFINNHAFLTKYMVNAKYAIFYFAQSFMGRYDPNDHTVVNFLNEMALEIRTDNFYKELENAHRNYFYITVNYFLDSDNNLKKLK